MFRRRLRIAAALAGTCVLASCGGDGSREGAAGWSLPPPAASFDYQIGGDYPPPEGAQVVIRDWFAGHPIPGLYSICYVNGFQTQADEDDSARPDELSAWPADLVLRRLGDDPNWGGEYLIDISSVETRRRAADWVAPMLDECARKGFHGVEIDNLDSWSRFDGTPLAGRVPFGQAEAIEYATLLAQHAHRRGLAVGQKNAPELDERTSRREIGFDFAVAEQCGRFHECEWYVALFGGRVLDIEYDDPGFRRACASVGDRIGVIRRDIGVSARGSGSYRYRSCGPAG